MKTQVPIEIELRGGPLDGCVCCAQQTDQIVWLVAGCRLAVYRLEFDEPRVPSITPQGRYRYVFECYA